MVNRTACASRPTRSTSRTLPLSGGRRVALVERVGRGAHATVYRAVLESSYGLRRTVAVKLFAAVPNDDAESAIERFAHVCRRCASVRHEGVVDTYDFGVAEGRPFVVTELVEGLTLRQILDEHLAQGRRLRLDLALFIAAEVAEALTGAWSSRHHDGRRVDLLHLGLSPREVFLSVEGAVKVEGFELATVRSSVSSVSNLGGLGARAAASSPEVACGGAGDARSDVFSLGTILRELLVGPRFRGGVDAYEAMRLAREGYVQPLTFQPHLPEELLHVLTRSLELDPADRFPNVAAMASQLRRIALTMGATDGRAFLRQAVAESYAARDPDRPHEFSSEEGLEDAEALDAFDLEELSADAREPDVDESNEPSEPSERRSPDSACSA